MGAIVRATGLSHQPDGLARLDDDDGCLACRVGRVRWSGRAGGRRWRVGAWRSRGGRRRGIGVAHGFHRLLARRREIGGVAFQALQGLRAARRYAGTVGPVVGRAGRANGLLLGGRGRSPAPPRPREAAMPAKAGPATCTSWKSLLCKAAPSRTEICVSKLAGSGCGRQGRAVVGKVASGGTSALDEVTTALRRISDVEISFEISRERASTR